MPSTYRTCTEPSMGAGGSPPESSCEEGVFCEGTRIVGDMNFCTTQPYSEQCCNGHWIGATLLEDGSVPDCPPAIPPECERDPDSDAQCPLPDVNPVAYRCTATAENPAPTPNLICDAIQLGRYCCPDTPPPTRRLRRGRYGGQSPAG